jgi:hypothetical protein
MIEAVWNSETLVNLHQNIWHYNPEDSHPHTHPCENFKSYLVILAVVLVTNIFECNEIVVKCKHSLKLIMKY